MTETERMKILGTLHEVRGLLDGYVDIKDGSDGQPVANDAMKAVQLIDELENELYRMPQFPPNPAGRLDRLTDAHHTLPTGASSEFSNVLLGALSTKVSDEDWSSCLRTALRAITKREEKTAVPR